jgi:hypothetical protein
MEGLDLNDLDFDTSAIQLFDEDTGEIGKSEDGTPPAGLFDNAKGEDKNKNTDSEDPNLDPESVANQSKDKTQVQAGKTDTGDEGSDSSSPKMNETEQLYSNLAAEFKSKGVLPGLDVSKIRSLKDLEDAISTKIDSGLTERQRFIEEAQKSGVSVTEVSEKTDTIDKLKGVSPEFIRDDANEDFRRTAIMQDFIEKGYDSKRAESMAQRSIDAGTDIEDAEFALASLIKSEEDSLRGIIDNAKSEETKSLGNIKEYISTTKEVIPGFELNDSQKDELYNQITTDVGNKDNAFMLAQKSDPIGSRIKLEALFYLTKGLKDFSVFGQKQESSITNNIENLIRGANFTEAGAIDTNVSDSNSNFKLSDLKDLSIE